MSYSHGPSSSSITLVLEPVFTVTNIQTTTFATLTAKANKKLIFKQSFDISQPTNISVILPPTPIALDYFFECFVRTDLSSNISGYKLLRDGNEVPSSLFMCTALSPFSVPVHGWAYPITHYITSIHPSYHAFVKRFDLYLPMQGIIVHSKRRTRSASRRWCFLLLSMVLDSVFAFVPSFDSGSWNGPGSAAVNTSWVCSLSHISLSLSLLPSLLTSRYR